ncbi:hypothetical protein BV898_06733 [Hypsibius exemplaris]|uniref:SHSP domain-containing protein n=1 Tax=Hypsibius exemplaris TaxID=2072580 RepID=A0A1W0WVT6_HYPEX|nr:hypothetical protein BV898_06733 [Hypsibius exemplaris]
MSTTGNQNNVVEVRIPIMQRQTSVLDQDYGGSGGQFADEMRKMEEEMSRLTGQINEGNKRIASRIVQKTTTTTTRTTSGGGGGPVQQQPQPQPIQYSSPVQAGGNVQSQSSHTSTYSHQTTGTGAQGQPQQQPSAVQWASPTPSGGLQQSSQQQHSTYTHSNSGHSPSPGPASVTGSNIQQHSSHTSTSSHQTVTHHSNSGNQFDQFGQQQNQQQQFGGFNQQQNLDASNSQELQQWMGQLNSPLIHNHQDIANQDGKCLRLRFDVSQYLPDEISVKTVDGKLRVHAKHEEKSEHKSAYREFNKEFSLPIGTNPEAIKSTLSKDGILTVEAPLPGQQGQLGYGGQPALSNF